MALHPSCWFIQGHDRILQSHPAIFERIWIKYVYLFLQYTFFHGIKLEAELWLICPD